MRSPFSSWHRTLCACQNTFTRIVLLQEHVRWYLCFMTCVNKLKVVGAYFQPNLMRGQSVPFGSSLTAASRSDVASALP